MTEWEKPNNFDPFIIPKGELCKRLPRCLTPEEMAELGISKITNESNWKTPDSLEPFTIAKEEDAARVRPLTDEERRELNIDGKGDKMKANQYHQYCADFRNTSEYVFRWLRGQPSVGEESITDWLLYNLSIVVPALKYKKFTRHEEAKKTGADWEWWFVDDFRGLSLRIQAKKVMADKDNYDGIAHTNRHGLQIEKLIDDARRKNSLPFYSLYHAPDGSPSVLCGGMRDSGQGQGVFLAGAVNLHNEFIVGGRRRVEAADLLARSNPLHCLVCCQKVGPGMPDSVERIYMYLRDYYHENIEKLNSNIDSPGLHKDAPAYVQSLLKLEEAEIPDWWEKEFGHQIEGINSILITDLRDNNRKRKP